jgi:hypothetical protein
MLGNSLAAAQLAVSQVGLFGYCGHKIFLYFSKTKKDTKFKAAD